jgi:membrane protease YdiL (CAAX protease family)
VHPSILEVPSARYRGLPPAVSAAGSLILVGLGAVALVLRTRLAVLPTSDRVVALTAIFGAILVASLLVPAAPGRRHLHPGVVLFAGLVAVGVAAFAAGRPVPIPFGAWAIPLSLLAAVAEEALFRRAAYGALERSGPAVAIGLTALLFALIHIPLYGIAAFPVNLGAALLFGWQRWASGTWTVSAGTHAAANLLAVIAR